MAELKHCGDWPRTVAINLGMILFVLFAAEVVFGGWVFGPNYGSLIIPKDFQRRFDTANLYAGGGIIYYKRDGYGLRGEYDDPSKIDILALGGSTTNERFIDESQTWTAVLGQEFRRHGQEVVVVNAGVGGQSTIGHIKNFELWFPMIPDLKARYVLVYVGINDLPVAPQVEQRVHLYPMVVESMKVQRPPLTPVAPFVGIGQRRCRCRAGFPGRSAVDRYCSAPPDPVIAARRLAGSP